MSSERQPDRFTFTNTEAGRELRTNMVKALTAGGMTSEPSEENWTVEGWSGVVLILTVTSKRPQEGVLAADMKARGKKFGL